jgi:hypothetical protein
MTIMHKSFTQASVGVLLATGPGQSPLDSSLVVHRNEHSSATEQRMTAIALLQACHARKPPIIGSMSESVHTC